MNFDFSKRFRSEAQSTLRRLMMRHGRHPRTQDVDDLAALLASTFDRGVREGATIIVEALERTGT